MNITSQFDFYSLLGFVGMLVIVIAYHNNLVGKMKTQSFQYALLNLIGASLLLVSLLKHFNLGSFLIEVFWVIISIMGIIKAKKPQKNQHDNATDSSHDTKQMTSNTAESSD